MSTVPIEFPRKGLDEGWPQNEQPGQTSPLLQNVRIYDPQSGRARGAQRAGSRKFINQQIGAGNPVQAIHQVTLAVTPDAPPTGGPGGWFEVDPPENFTVDDPFVAGPGSIMPTVEWTVRVDAGRYADCFVTNRGAFDDTTTSPVQMVAGGAGSGNQVRFLPASSRRAFAAIYEPSDLKSTPHRVSIAVNMDEVEVDAAEAIAFLSVRVAQTLGTTTDLGMVTLRVVNREVVQVIIGIAPDGGTTNSATASFHTTLDTPLSGFFTLAIDVIEGTEGPGSTLGRTFNFYLNGVLLYFTVATSTAGTFDFPGDGGTVTAAFGAVNADAPLSGIASIFFDDFRIVGIEFVPASEQEIAPQVNRQTYLVAVAGGNVYWTDDKDDEFTSWTLATGGTGALSAVRKPSLCNSQGKVYMVDGTNTIVLDVRTQTVTTLAATAGSIPAGCRICTIWRDRLVLANQDGSEQNVYMSRSGTHTDFNYNPTVSDALQAVALNASTAGRIGFPVFALIPFRDDVLLIGGDHSIYALVGDPADGGSLTAATEAIGMLTPDGWTVDPNGTIYFVGTGGFFKMGASAQPPENISLGRLDRFFSTFGRNRFYVECEWDRDANACHIFITPITPGAATHLYYDARSDAFIKDVFPDAHGPICALVYDGDKANDRALMMGGRDGYVRKLVASDVTDDGTAIDSYAAVGPISPAGALGRSRLVETEIVTGSTTTNLRMKVYAADDANAALALLTADTPALNVAFTTGGRQNKIRTRVKGNTFVFRFSNVASGAVWSFERGACVIEDAGRMR